MAKSADTSFRLIASSKKLLTRGQLGEAASRAQRGGISLEAAVGELGFLKPEDFERIATTRERHARDCSSCGDVTFLLPKQTVTTTPCEHCQSPLVPSSEDKQARRPRSPGAAGPGPAGPRPGPGPGPGPGAGAAPRPTGRRIPTKEERAARDAAQGKGTPSTAAHDASRAAAEASHSAVGDITFSAPADEMAALLAEAKGAAPPQDAPAADPLDAATPPGQGGDESGLEFRSVAYSASDVAKIKEEAEAGPPPEAAAKPKQPPRAEPEEDAPTIPPSRPVADAPQSAIGTPVKAPSASPRDLRQQGGGFGYEPPAELAPRPGRLGGPRASPAQTEEDDSPRKLQKKETFEYEPPSELAARPGRPGSFAGGVVGAASTLGGGGAGASTPDEGPPHEEDEDDDRFAPPAKHFADHTTDEEHLVIPPLREDLKRILMLPLEKDGLGMLILGTFMMGAISIIPWTPFTILPVLAMMAYPITFLISCTRYGSVGRESLPDWPDFDLGLIANLWRTIQVWFACAFPVIAILLPLGCLAGMIASSAAPKPNQQLPIFSIGTSAHSSRRTESDWFVPKGTDLSGTVFLEPGTDNEVELGGKWTVIGLLNRSNADDTMTTVDFTDMGAASALGSAGVPGFQAHDLDRVGRAMGTEAVVYAAYADPDERIVQGRFPWLRPGQEEEEEDEEEEEYDREAEVGKALDKASRTMTLKRNKRRGDNGIRVSTPFEGLSVLKTSDWTFPGKFEGIKPLPVVYVLDASGKVVKEYGAGVDDEQLYGDLKDLIRGGDGDTSGKSLPPHIKPPKSVVMALLAGGGMVFLVLIAVPVIVAGYFYWPAAQLIMVTFDSGAMAFNYPAAIRAIRAGFKDYLALVGILVGLSIVGSILGEVLKLLLFMAPGFIRSGVSGFFSSIFYFYTQIVGAYAIGRYYYANKEAIGWFGGR